MCVRVCVCVGSRCYHCRRWRERTPRRRRYSCREIAVGLQAHVAQRVCCESTRIRFHPGLRWKKMCMYVPGGNGYLKLEMSLLRHTPKRAQHSSLKVSLDSRCAPLSIRYFFACIGHDFRVPCSGAPTALQREQIGFGVRRNYRGTPGVTDCPSHPPSEPVWMICRLIDNMVWRHVLAGRSVDQHSVRHRYGFGC